MYWKRSDNHNGNCFTKVYAVLADEFLLLYRSDDTRSSSKFARPLVDVAVASADRTPDGAFCVADPNGVTLQLHLYDRRDAVASFVWTERLQLAVACTQRHVSAITADVTNAASEGVCYRNARHFRKLVTSPSSGVRHAVHAVGSRLRRFGLGVGKTSSSSSLGSSRQRSRSDACALLEQAEDADRESFRLLRHHSL